MLTSIGCKRVLIALFIATLAILTTSCSQKDPRTPSTTPASLKSIELEKLTLTFIKVNNKAYYIKLRVFNDLTLAEKLKRSCLLGDYSKVDTSLISKYKLVDFSQELKSDIESNKIRFIPSAIEGGCMYDFTASSDFNLEGLLTLQKSYNWEFTER